MIMKVEKHEQIQTESKLPLSYKWLERSVRNELKAECANYKFYLLLFGIGYKPAKLVAIDINQLHIVRLVHDEF